jgi:5'-nucleotidase
MAGSLNNSRRTFLKDLSLTVAAGACLPVSGFAASDNKDAVKLTILHTNDVHSQIDPFDDNHPKFPGMGGAAIRSAIIRKIRSEERNVLLFDAGDIFQGTPYFNLFGGELELKLMSHMGYDAATLGNHEFDNGIEGLVKQLPHARFTMINSNYDFSNTLMEGKSRPYKIFAKQGLKIGVFGLGIDLNGLVDKRLYGNLKYYDPLPVTERISSYLKHRKKCDLVICLSHLGHHYKSEKISDLAVAAKSSFVDLIIGGHTHTFLDEPVTEVNKLGQKVLVTQAGFAGLRLGRIDYFFDRKTGKKSITTAAVMEMRKSSEI